jgi:hypothetical protein
LIASAGRIGQSIWFRAITNSDWSRR